MSKTILLADDSVTIQKVVELTFLDEGHRVLGVTHGDEALARWEAMQGAYPDLVIADVHMPGANGYAVARQVKADSPQTPVLLLVGTFEPFQKDEFDACGADAYLKKPFDSQELLRQVADLLGRGQVPTPAPGGSSIESLPTQFLPDLAPRLTGDSRAAQETRWESFAVEEFDAGVDQTPTHPLDPLEPPSAPAPLIYAGAPAAGAGASTALSLSDMDIDRIARRVVEVMSEKVVREIAWEVIPDLAEVTIQQRLRELERPVD